jgi:hypothetical protein
MKQQGGSSFPIHRSSFIISRDACATAAKLLCFLFTILRDFRRKEPGMGARRIRREQRRADMAESRHRNGILKTKERARRETRLREALKKGKLPYTPTVLSWLSAELDKPGRLITQSDVDHLLKKSKGPSLE